MPAEVVSSNLRTKCTFVIATVVLHACIVGILVQWNYLSLVELSQRQYAPSERTTNDSDDGITKFDDNLPTASVKFDYLKEPVAVLIGPNNNECVAKQSVKWKMAIFVKSSADNFKRREFLRRTWASYRFVQDGMIQTIFVIGNATDPATNQLLFEEFERYRDILQYSGPDDYRNIALKTLAGMQWCSQHFQNVDFYASADDDFLIDLVEMRNTLVEYMETMIKDRWPEYPIVCMYEKRQNDRPLRKKSKWHVSIEEYKWTKWPDFCLGGFYSMSVNVTKQLWDVAKVQKPLSMDDVWITGILRQHLGMPESMLVVPGKERTVATHTVGYKKDKSKTVRGFMQTEWEKLKQKFDNIIVCNVQYY